MIWGKRSSGSAWNRDIMPISSSTFLSVTNCCCKGGKIGSHKYMYVLLGAQMEGEGLAYLTMCTVHKPCIRTFHRLPSAYFCIYTTMLGDKRITVTVGDINNGMSTYVKLGQLRVKTMKSTYKLVSITCLIQDNAKSNWSCCKYLHYSYVIKDESPIFVAMLPCSLGGQMKDSLVYTVCTSSVSREFLGIWQIP